MATSVPLLQLGYRSYFPEPLESSAQYLFINQEFPAFQKTAHAIPKKKHTLHITSDRHQHKHYVSTHIVLALIRFPSLTNHSSLPPNIHPLRFKKNRSLSHSIYISWQHKAITHSFAFPDDIPSIIY